MQRSSSTACFEAMFEAHFDDVWRYLRRRTNSDAAADDLSAQAFATAWRRWDDVPVGEERLWLFGVARRLLANDRRSSARQQRLVDRIKRVGPLALGSPPDLHAVEPALDLSRLSSRELEAIRLCYWDQLTVAEIAQLLNCTPNAVSLRLHKARNKLAASASRTPGVDSGAPRTPTSTTNDRSY